MTNLLRLLGPSICILVNSPVLGLGGQFRLTFLQDKVTLQETCSLLLERHFSADSVATFEKLVQHHNKNGNRVDVSNFPTQVGGYYHFDNVSQFTNCLKRLYSETEANNTLEEMTLMCFDVTSLLLNGLGCNADDLYSSFDSKNILEIRPVQSQVKPAKYETFRNGINLLFPTNGYEYLVGRQRSPAETRLGLCLRAPRRVLHLHNDEESCRRAFSQYVAGIQQDGFKFPNGIRLGIVLNVNFRYDFVKADHAFLCAEKGGKLVIIEKNGTKGPYVRAEFDSERDLALYCSIGERVSAVDPKDDDYGCGVVVSLNSDVLAVYLPRNSSLDHP
jgi:hypothetical protein